ncbi:MAG: hypothetical protein V1706_03290 [Pseudomonadota bacterium]
METNKVFTVTAVLTILLVMPLAACAQNNGRRQGPPPEAIEACENKNAGDSVKFTGRRGESLEATCQEIDGQLVAVPEGMPPGGRK